MREEEKAFSLSEEKTVLTDNVLQNMLILVPIISVRHPYTILFNSYCIWSLQHTQLYLYIFILFILIARVLTAHPL